MEDSVHKMIGAALIKESENLTERENMIKRYASYYHSNKDKVEQLTFAFGSKINCIGAEVAGSCFDIKITGDKHMLQATFAVFRKLGYEPSERPGTELLETFSCFWDHPDHSCRLWLYLTSDICKRVKIGTKMVERDIYETVCQ